MQNGWVTNTLEPGVLTEQQDRQTSTGQNSMSPVKDGWMDGEHFYVPRLGNRGTTN